MPDGSLSAFKDSGRGQIQVEPLDVALMNGRADGCFM